MSTNRSVVNQNFTGVRVRVDSPLAVDEVLSRLRSLMGKTRIQEVVSLAQTAISETEYIRQVTKLAGESGFMPDTEINHGGYLPKFGIHRRSVRLIFGNPVIAVTMIRNDITAGLFAPVEILVTDDMGAKGTSVFYVRPSSLMVIEDNPPLLAAAQVLDAKLDALVDRATAA